MSTSGTYDWAVNQDQVIKRAMRISGNLATGQSPTQAQWNEASQALNDIIKEWCADGMQLWCIGQVTIPLVTNQAAYVIGVNAANNFPPFLKVINCFKRTIATGEDIPMVLITRWQYNQLSNKSQGGDPNQYWYSPPGNEGTGNMAGTLTLFNTPNAFAATTYNLQVVGQVPIQDLTLATDIVDFPNYFNNALVWGLADQLAYESPLPVSEKDRITKKMMYHKEQALDFGTEMGSLFIQPDTFWLMEQNGGWRG